MNRIVLAVAALMIGAAAPVMAESPAKASVTSESKAADNFVSGEVKKVDKEAGKITLKHGPIPNLEMPGMTMVFRAKDPKALDKIKAGDMLKFKAEKIDGNITIVEFKPAP